MARPSSYDPADNIRVQGWARDGLTNEQIAANLDINIDTLYEWRKRYPEFAEALKKSREVADREIENALFRNATGYDTEEQTLTKSGDVVAVTKHVPPNVTAQIFWLKNRKPQDWRDRREIEHSGDAEKPVRMEVKASVEPYLAGIAAAVDDFLARDTTGDGDRQPLDTSEADT